MLMLSGKGNLTKRRTGMRYRFQEVAVPLPNGRYNYVLPVMGGAGEETRDADEVSDTIRDPEAKASIKAGTFLAKIFKHNEKPSARYSEASRNSG